MAAALLVMSGFGVFSYYQYRVSQERLHDAERQRARAEKSERDARKASEDAVREKERAETNQRLADEGFEEARATVDELLTEMSQEGLKEIPGLQELRQRFAEKAVAHYVIYLARRPHDLAVTDGHARSLTALGTVMGEVGSVDKAVEKLGRAIQICESLVTREPGNLEYRYHLARDAIRARLPLLVPGAESPRTTLPGPGGAGTGDSGRSSAGEVGVRPRPLANPQQLGQRPR